MDVNETQAARAASVAWIKNQLEHVVRSIVDVEDAVSMGTRYGEQTAVIMLKVDKSDLGKVIGKAGRNIQAIRTILNSLAAKRKVRVVLELEEDTLRTPRLAPAKA